MVAVSSLVFVHGGCEQSGSFFTVAVPKRGVLWTRVHVWLRAAVTSSQFVHGGWVRPSLFAEAEGGRSCFAVAVAGSSGLF